MIAEEQDFHLMAEAREVLHRVADSEQDDTWYEIGDALCCYLVGAYDYETTMKRIKEA